MGLRRAVTAVVVVIGAATTACGFLLGSSSSEEPAAVDSGSDSSPPICTAPEHDLAGCLCPTIGEARSCAQGLPGPKSACKTEGTQQCAQADGALRWSACVGGPMPAAAETCGDDVDDDCDGKIDQGCPCSDEFDLCRSSDGVAYPPDAYTLVTIPNPPTATAPFDLYIVTKDKELADAGLRIDNHCAGGAIERPACASPGSGCAGWKVLLIKSTDLPAGAQVAGKHDVLLWVPNREPPCPDPADVKLQFTVQ